MKSFDYVGHVRLTDIPNFDKMSDLERLELAEELITSVRDPGALPAPVAHRLELERRWAKFEQDPDSALSEEKFWTRIQSLKS